MTGILDNLAATLRDAVATVSEKAQQFQNQSFADSCMGTCALMAMADGVLQPEERAKVVKCIQNIRDLHCFKATDLRDSFDAYCRQSTDAFGRVEVVKAIRKVKGDPDQADTVVKIGLIIAKSKGDLAEIEKTVIREIIHELGLNESDYDLGPTGPASTSPRPPAGGSAVPPLPVAPVSSPAQPPVVTPRPAPVQTAAPSQTAAPATQPASGSSQTAHRPRVQGTSLKEAKPGERVSFKQLGATPSKLVVGLGWDAAPNVSLTSEALLFDKEKKLVQKVGLGSATAGGVSHNGNVSATSAVGDDEELALDLSALAAAAGAAATSVLFVIRSASGQSAQGVKSAYVRIIDPDKKVQVIRFDFAAGAAPVALVAGRVYLNNGEWKFAAVGESVSGGDTDKLIATFA